MSIYGNTCHKLQSSYSFWSLHHCLNKTFLQFSKYCLTFMSRKGEQTESCSVYFHIIPYISVSLFLYFIFIVVVGYIVTFTKFLTIFHSRIQPLHYSPLFPVPHSWISFKRSHFSIYIYVYRIFPPYSPHDLLSLYPPPSHPLSLYPPSQSGLVWPSCSCFC
jgi:hypothetical protein